MRRSKGRALFFALCLSSLLVLAAGQPFHGPDCFSNNTDDVSKYFLPTSIVIGALLPTSSYVGPEVEAAVRLAVWNVNNNSLLLGDTTPRRKICMLIADSRADPFSGFQGALRLAGERMVGVVGPFWASVGDIVAPLANKAQVPFISPAAFTTAFHVTQGAGVGGSEMPFLRRVCCNNARNTELVINIVRAYGWKRMAVLVADNDYGHSSSQQLSAAARQHSIIIPKTLPVSPKLDDNSSNPIIMASDMTVLTELKLRIFVCMVMDNQIEDILTAANKSGLVGGDYAWIFANVAAHPELLVARFNSSGKTAPLLRGAVFTQLASSSTTASELLSDWRQVASQWLPSAMQATTINPFALLAYDTVQLLAEAIHTQLQEAGSFDAAFDYRTEAMVGGLLQLPVLLNGSALLKSLSNTSIDGYSGRLRVDQGGDVDRDTSYVIYNVLGNISVLEVGTWSSLAPPSKWQATTPIVWHNGSTTAPPDQDRSAKQVLRILVPRDDEPYIFHDKEQNGTKGAFSGFAIDLLKHLSENIGFTYELELWNGTWDRMVETVGRPDTTYDMAIGDITVTSYRELVCDFTSSFFQSSYRILVRRPDSSSASGLWQFFDPFSWDVWVMLLVFLFFSSFMLYFLEHWHLRHVSPGLAETMWVSFSTFYSTQKAEKITSNYGRFYLIVACFIVMVINAAFTANMTSFLLDKDITLPYATLQEVGQLGVGVQGGTATYRYIKNVEHVSTIVKTSYDNAVQDLKSGKIAVFINNEPSQKYLALNDCGVALSGNSFHQEKYAFALKRGSPLLASLNQAILNAWDSGYIEDLYYRRFVWNDPCKSSSSDTEALRLSNVGGLFIMVLVAAAVCLIGHVAMQKIESVYPKAFEWSICMDTPAPLAQKSDGEAPE